MTNLRHIAEESQRLSQIISDLYSAGDEDYDTADSFFILL